jgi:hypothetical protein
MFQSPTVAELRVNPRPELPLSPKTRLELATQDPRSEDEKEYDRMKAAEAQTYALFDEQQGGDKSPALPPEPLPTKLFPSGLRYKLMQVNEPEPEYAVQLTEVVVVRYWTTRDEEYERARDSYHRQGYRTFPAGDDQLEIITPDDKGLWRVTYSDMEMVENIEWIEEIHH